ncbi:Protein patched-like protein 1 [Aphelenchoides fujianensis]|nr:Protein patched-like protein 1 [Aphelenchoides fujianensis]
MKPPADPAPAPTPPTPPPTAPKSSPAAASPAPASSPVAPSAPPTSSPQPAAARAEPSTSTDRFVASPARRVESAENPLAEDAKKAPRLDVNGLIERLMSSVSRDKKGQMVVKNVLAEPGTVEQIIARAIPGRAAMPFLFFAGNDGLSLLRGDQVEDDSKIIRWQETGKLNGRRKRRRHIYKLQDLLFKLGQFVHTYSAWVIFTVFSIFCICCIGLQYVRIETDIVKLWVSEGGRLNEELKYFKKVQDKYGNPTWTAYDEEHFIPEDEAGNPAYQVLIQTAEYPEQNLLTKEGLERHVKLLEYIVGLEVTHLGVNWTLADICFKPGALDIPKESVAYSIKPILERLIPCIWITPVDCFFEGSKPIGPHPPLSIKDIPMGELLRVAMPDLPDESTWSNLNPASIVEVLKQNFDLGTMTNFFSRTGIDEGYLNRPCINPLDPACPKQAPNHYDACPGMLRFEQHLKRREQDPRPVDNSKGGKSGEMNDDCKKYRSSFLKWIDQNPHTARDVLGPKLMPVYPEYGSVMRKGCNGFAKDSVILVSSATDVYKRYVGNQKIADLAYFNETLGQSIRMTDQWSPFMARDMITKWQRKFTAAIYDHPFNFVLDKQLGEKVEHRTIHPLAASSISEILANYCDFNYLIILIGYLLMLVYAVYTQIHCDNFLLSANSSVGLALAGVFTVTMASIAGLGFVTWIGVEFNAATTQVIPFLTLGIGVDNMFMLLHNYPAVVRNAKRDEIGMLMRETGMSILLTSVNNILSFMAGTILPIPALRSFCLQSSVLLTFNLLAIMTVYPALISIDLRRRKSGRRDICCCLQSSDGADEESYESFGFDLGIPIASPANGKPQYHGLISMGKEDDEEHNEVRPWSLHACLRNYYVPLLKNPYTKGVVLCMSLLLFFGCAYQIRNLTIGLELSDVLPENTAPAAFLRARDKYFSFYPFNVIVRGEEVDFAHKQAEIEHLRNEIARSKFIIKLDNGEPSERYWLGLFREWLQGLQSKLDAAKAAGILEDFDNNNHTKPPELRIAYSLACSYGEEAGKIRLVDESGIINTEGFYNYLYGWHEYESMFYTVSQASFYPPLRKLKQGPLDNKYRYFVPPAPKPIYSQIPFYLNNLIDTPIIVEMIKEIRGICERYTREGLAVFPTGIAFTFWEQYLDLSWYLFMAIVIIGTAVFLVISITVVNPWAAAMVTIIVVSMTVELCGFMGLVGVKLNAISAVTLITAVGIGVEFTAHVVLAFLITPGTRNERMATAVDQTFVPVLHGAVSTLLGILMLGFSEFDFVVVYFFTIMAALIFIGIINGLILLPVLLSLIGPPCRSNKATKLRVLVSAPAPSATDDEHLPTINEENEPNEESKKNSNASASKRFHAR